MRFLRIAFSAFFLLGMVVVPGHSESEVGVIVVANSGSKTWTKSVHAAVRAANMPYTTRVFMGAGDSPMQQADLQAIVHDLEDDGANTIVVIPLTSSPFSEAFRQWRYLLGVDVQPGFNNTPLFPVERHSTIRFAEPLNDSAVVVEILLDRIQEISRKAAEESVFVVTYGPRDSSDNTRWLRTLQNLSRRVQERGNFKSVEGISLRDDIASGDDRPKSMEEFRKKVEKVQVNSRVVIVSLALTPNALENKLALELRGLSYVYNNKPLMPDARISEWIRSQLP